MENGIFNILGKVKFNSSLACWVPEPVVMQLSFIIGLLFKEVICSNYEYVSHSE